MQSITISLSSTNCLHSSHLMISPSSPLLLSPFLLCWLLAISVDECGQWVCSFLLQYSKMQKSMVQELSVLTHSTIFSSRPSFLTSDHDRLDLRRSRIQNLPGYRKEDLSSKLNFVVVFQTIEIERLTQQLQTLRIMTRDAERQRLNFQNYEVQIRELTERCHAYEMHREDLQDQLERLKTFTARLVGQIEEQAASRDEGMREKYLAERSRAEQLQGEVERWRNRHSGLQVARTKELEQLRGEFEARRRSQISRETRELTIKYENEVAALSSDLRKAREEAQLRAGEAGRLQELVGKFRLREEEMQEVEEKMYEYENRFVLLSQENYRLNELLRKRSEDLDRARRDASESRTRADSRIGVEEELTKLQTAISEKQQAIDELQSRLRGSRQQKEQMGLQVQKGQDYIRLVQQLQGEVQRLNGILRDKINEGEQGRSSQRILETKLAAATAATQKECASYQQRIVSFTKEQERLSAQLKHRLAENEQLRVRCGELERMGNSNDALRQENEQLRGQLGQYSNKLEESKRKIKLHEDNLALMEDIERKLRSEEQLKRDLLLDREKLNAIIRQLTLKSQTAVLKAQSTQQQLSRVAGVEGELGEYKQRLAWMTQELDRINSEIQVRVGELQQLRESLRTLNSNKGNYQGIEQRLVQNLAQMEQLVLQLDHTRRENDRLHDDNMNFQTNLRSLQGQIITLHDERDERTRLLASQASELNQLREKGELVAGEVKARQQAESAMQQQNKKLEQYKGMYSQLEERFARETAHSEAMVYELMQMRSQPRIGKELAEELVGLRRLADEQRMMITGLLQRMEAIQNLLRGVRERYGREMEEVNMLKQRVQALLGHSQCIDDLQMVFSNFGDRMDCLREEKFKLESEKALINVEYCESLKILQEPIVTPPSPHIKNSSIALKVGGEEGREEESGYLFTFKEVHRQQSMQQQQDAINERTETEENETSHSPEEGSMASSFINTLITKESSARFDLRPQQQESDGNNVFGYNHNSKLRYLPDRFQEYHPIEREIENLPAQLNRAISPSHRSSGAFFETAGIKRVVSYTHFAPTMIPSPASPISYPSCQARDSPSGASPNTANSTNEHSQLGKRIRISVDPARLLLYRNQH